MSSQITRSLQAFLLIWLPLLFCSPVELHAQEVTEESVLDVQISIEPKAETWMAGEPAPVIVKIKNRSNKVAKLHGTYYLALSKGRHPPIYVSYLDIVGGTALRPPTLSELLEKGEAAWKDTEQSIKLEPGEVKAVTFDLSRLLWCELRRDTHKQYLAIIILLMGIMIAKWSRLWPRVVMIWNLISS